MPADVETMFSVRETPWHVLGRIIMDAPASREALELAGLDWQVESRNIYSGTGGGHSGVGDALAVLQVVIADVRDGNGSVHETQIFGVEQLILRKQFFAEMEAVLPQEVTAASSLLS